jgi:diaminohydroxyphosphoribosylaminopyrimidine deaminase/5-amino-6-(5-phosphoribosylamino)uracil reductase
LIADLEFQSVIIGTLDPTENAAGGAKILAKRGIDVHLNVMKQECDNLLYPFVSWQKGNFTFFKLALTLNGVITGGTLSCVASRTHMHHLRSCVDELIIGGNTVRLDRPTLDARLCEGRAPDVAIFSKSTNFDQSIPLFNISSRNVRYCDHIDECKKSKFVMIEGGEGMARALENDTNLWYLFYVTPSFSQAHPLSLDAQIEFLYTQPLGDDVLIWARQKSRLNQS